MANIRIGGDPSSYMQAPTLSVGGDDSGGTGGFIANLLDLLGVHRQVAKEPKAEEAPAEGEVPAAESTPAKPARPPIDVGSTPARPNLDGLPALAAATQAFTPIEPLPQTFGQRWMDSLQPLQSIDPNTGQPFGNSGLR
jgi:hypothetical protein